MIDCDRPSSNSSWTATGRRVEGGGAGVKFDLAEIDSSQTLYPSFCFLRLRFSSGGRGFVQPASLPPRKEGITFGTVRRTCVEWPRSMRRPVRGEENRTGEENRRQRASSTGGGERGMDPVGKKTERRGGKKRKGDVWFGSGRWASNSGHRARMTSNRSRALCQHSAPNSPVILILRFIDAAVGGPSRSPERRTDDPRVLGPGVRVRGLWRIFFSTAAFYYRDSSRRVLRAAHRYRKTITRQCPSNDTMTGPGRISQTKTGTPKRCPGKRRSFAFPGLATLPIARHATPFHNEPTGRCVDMHRGVLDSPIDF